MACRGSVNDNEIMDAVPSKYLSFDSIPLEHWDSNRTRNYPYNLVKSVYNSYLDLRFDYYVFKTDGQSFPFKKVIVTKDTLSFTLDLPSRFGGAWPSGIKFNSNVENTYKQNIEQLK